MFSALLTRRMISPALGRAFLSHCMASSAILCTTRPLSIRRELDLDVSIIILHCVSKANFTLSWNGREGTVICLSINVDMISLQDRVDEGTRRKQVGFLCVMVVKEFWSDPMYRTNALVHIVLIIGSHPRAIIGTVLFLGSFQCDELSSQTKIGQLHIFYGSQENVVGVQVTVDQVT